MFTKGMAGSEIKLGDKIHLRQLKISPEVLFKTATPPVRAASSDDTNHSEKPDPITSLLRTASLGYKNTSVVPLLS